MILYMILNNPALSSICSFGVRITVILLVLHGAACCDWLSPLSLADL